MAAGLVVSVSACAAVGPSDDDLTAALADATPTAATAESSHPAREADAGTLAKARALAYAAPTPATAQGEADPFLLAARAALSGPAPRFGATGANAAPPASAITPEEMLARLRSLAAAARSERRGDDEGVRADAPETAASLGDSAPTRRTPVLSPEDIMERLRALSATGKIEARAHSAMSEEAPPVKEADLRAFGGLPASLRSPTASAPSLPAFRLDVESP